MDDANGIYSVNSPHISGLSLFIMGKEGKLSPKALADRLQALAVPNIIQGVTGGTTTSFAFNGVQP